MNRVGNERTGNALLRVPAAGGVELVESTMAVIDADGYAKPAGTGENVLAAGCVQIYCDNRLGSDGEKPVHIKRGTFVWANDGTIKNTDMLKICYIKDAETVTLTAEGSSPAGIILEADDLFVTVDMTCNAVLFQGVPGTDHAAQEGEQDDSKSE